MGIIKLNKYLNEYILNTNLKEQINSEICYIDYTANLVITTSMIMKKYKQTNLNLNISEICNEIIDTCKTSLVEQIKNNKYFTKYIIVFDYKYLSKFNLNFKLSEELLNECINNLQFNKDHIDAIPMIPKTYLNEISQRGFQVNEIKNNDSLINGSLKNENNLNEISQRGFRVNENNKTLNINIPISTLKESVRNLYELRIKGEITNYQNIYYMYSKALKEYSTLDILDKKDDEFIDVNSKKDEKKQSSLYKNKLIMLQKEIQILKSLINFGLTRYIVLRGAKNITRRNRNIKNVCKTSHSQKSFLISSSLNNVLDNINVRLYEALNEDSCEFFSENNKDKLNINANQSEENKYKDINVNQSEESKDKDINVNINQSEESKDKDINVNVNNKCKDKDVNINQSEENKYKNNFKCNSEFDTILNNFKNTVNYTLIVNLIPILISRVKEQIKDLHLKEIVEFIGCENESDFVIRKHILLYNSLNCPTIYTNDSDLFMLLCDINCYIRVKSPLLNIRIKPNLFWQWLTGLENIYLNDIAAFCCILGNDYNHFKFMKWKVDNLNDIRELFKNNKNLYSNAYNHALKLYNKYHYLELLQFLISLEIYRQCDYIENEIHHISRINENSCNKLLNEAIELKYRNIFNY